MIQTEPVTHSGADLHRLLEAMTQAEIDSLAFGVIGFDADGIVRRYNQYESRLAGLAPQRVLGLPLFTAVAPCMNNFMVSQQFADAAARGERLDVALEYVFTLRMRPTRVRLRLLAAPEIAMRYVAVDRNV